MSYIRLRRSAPRILAALGLLLFLLPGSPNARTSDRHELHGPHCRQDVLENLLSKARSGDRNAQFVMAFMYGAGHCLRQDTEKRLEWLEKAANQDHPEALFQLATAYYRGKGLEQNTVIAGRLYRRAAKLGHAGSQKQLGLIMLRDGERTEADTSQGLYWLGSAATNGDALSALLVAYMYETGTLGVSEDKCLAWDWYEASFLLGMQDAKRHMARLDEAGGCVDGK